MSRERLCRWTLRGLAVSFGVAGTNFLLAPDTTIRSLNRVGASLGDFPPAPVSPLRFWLTLAAAYMLLVTLLAWLAQRDLRRYRHLLPILAAGKASSSLIALAFFLWGEPCFLYLLNFLVDGSITLTVAAIWVAVPSLPVNDRESLRGRAPGWRDRTLTCVLEALTPPGGPFPEGGGSAPERAAVEAFVARAGAAPAFGALLALLELSPWFLPPVWLRRFSKLPLEDRVRVLAAWEDSRLWPRRQALQMLKLVGQSRFYARRDVQDRIGHPDPLERIPRDEPSVASPVA